MLSQQLFDLSWELVLLNDLPAWRGHRDFYSGLSIIINQTCDFGQNHLAFTSPQLSHLPEKLSLPCLIHSIFVTIKPVVYVKVFGEYRKLIVRLCIISFTFSLPWFTLLVLCSGFLSQNWVGILSCREAESATQEESIVGF